MSHVPLSPMHKVSHPHPLRTSSQDSTDGIRKRVCKACDRCRLKKSKCDGSSPCTRCKADNAICVFGERKKSQDKVYPKGYVEMLEQQQGQLVSGLQEMYKRLRSAQAWPGATLPETSGHPLTHDILTALDLLETRPDGSGEVESFEEDPQKLQAKLIADGAGYVHRRGSFSSDSEPSQHDLPRPVINTAAPMSKPPSFRDSFNFGSASPSPTTRSPVHRQLQTFPTTQPSQPQHTSPLTNDPQFYQAEWAVPDMSTSDQIMRSSFAMQAPMMQDSLSHIEGVFANNRLDVLPAWNDASLGGMPMTSYPQQLSSTFDTPMQGGVLDFGFDTADIEFNKFITAQT